MPSIDNPIDELRKKLRQSLTKGLGQVGRGSTKRPKTGRGGRPSTGRPGTGGTDG
jgi:hypothetical protein